MDEIQFNSAEELYHRLEPALKTKIDEFKLQGITIKEKDLWFYLIENKWQNAHDLLLHQMVDDIMTCDLIKINEHLNNRQLDIKEG